MNGHQWLEIADDDCQPTNVAVLDAGRVGRLGLWCNVVAPAWPVLSQRMLNVRRGTGPSRFGLLAM